MRLNPISPQNYDQGPPYTIEVFLSHDWGDRVGDYHLNHEKVRKIKDILVSLTRSNPKYRLKVWFDENRLLPGDDIAPTLMKAIEDTDIFIYFVTKNYQNKFLQGESDYCYLELQHAIDEKKMKIPVILEESMKVEANREGSFAQIISGIFYSDFSTEGLFNDLNETLLIHECTKLVRAIKSKYRNVRLTANPDLNLPLSETSSTVTSNLPSSGYVSPVSFLFPQEHMMNQYQLVPSNNQVTTTTAAVVVDGKCTSHELPLEGVDRFGQLKCPYCLANVFSIKDFIRFNQLKAIFELLPDLLISRKFTNVEKYLEDLVTNKINTWTIGVKKDISSFYQSINIALKERFDYLKTKNENRQKRHELDTLYKSISMKVNLFRHNHEQQCEIFFTELYNHLNKVLILPETDRIDNCKTEFHQYYVSSYKMFHSYWGEFNDRVKKFAEPLSSPHSNNNNHNSFAMAFKDNRSFYVEFYQLNQRFLNDLQALASIPDDPLKILEAIIDFDHLDDKLRKEGDQERREKNLGMAVAVDSGAMEEMKDVRNSSTVREVKPSTDFLNARRHRLFLHCLKYYNHSNLYNSNNARELPNFFEFLTTNDHYFPNEDLLTILQSISKLQYFPLEYYPYPVIKDDDDSNLNDGKVDDEEEEFMKSGDGSFLSLTLLFKDLYGISILHHPFIYRIQNKCNKFDWYHCFKNISWRMIISYLLDIAAVCCGFIAFSIMVGSGFSDSSCVDDFRNNIYYCYLDNNLSYDNQFFLAYSCLIAVYALVRALFALKVMLWKSSLFEESVINFLGFAVLSTVVVISLINLLTTFLANTRLVSGIYALTSGYCYDIHCSSHSTLTSEGLTSAEIAASVACFNQTIGKGAVTACATRSRDYSSSDDEIDSHCVFFHGLLTMDDIENKEDSLNVVIILVAIFIADVSLQWVLFVGRSTLIRK